MNVVFLPALASSLASAWSDGVFCDQWTCLFGWAWSVVALMLAAAWLTNRWSLGSDTSVARRLQPVGMTTSAATAFAPKLAGLASPTGPAPARPTAVLAAAAGLALRGPPTTDMAALPPATTRLREDGQPSSPSPRPTRSTGTPCSSEVDDGSGQPSPV